MSDNYELLHQAIERNTPIALLLPSAGMMRPFRSRLLSISKDGILLESVSGQAEALDHLIKSQQPITVSFRSDTQKVEFVAPIIRRLRGHRLNADMLVEALELTLPQTVKAVQRRSDYRVTVPSDSDITFSFWRISEQAELEDPAPAGARMVIDVRDFSSGGIGGTWKRSKDDPPTLAANQRVRVQIDGPQGPLILDGRIRFLERLQDADRKRVGVQFSMNSNSIPDRQKMMGLNKIIGELQRMELRRKKFAR